MSHAHRVARYTQLLRANPLMRDPQPRRITVEEVRLWKMRIRAVDEAKIRLKLATPEEIQRRNEAVHTKPGGFEILSWARYG